MSSIIYEQRVRDVMPAPSRPEVEVRAGAPFELLIALSALTGEEGDLSGCSPALRRALERVGMRSGELWLHLLGLALEQPASLDSRGFVDAVAATAPLELRRHLVGVHVPTWRDLVGAEMLERAARGNRAAAAGLLRHDRYYAGRARDALALLLPLTPAQTKRRVVDVLRLFVDEVFAPREAEVVRLLEEEARRQREAAASRPPEAAIAAVTRGYVYEPEPEFARVVLIPQLAAAPWLLLCQHRDARLICYAVERESTDAEEAVADRALALGRALADERRIRILRRLVAGDASLGELADAAGLAKSTAHHHLSQLRAAGLVTMGGNARGYWYRLRPEGFAEARAVIGELGMRS